MPNLHLGCLLFHLQRRKDNNPQMHLIHLHLQVQPDDLLASFHLLHLLLLDLNPELRNLQLLDRIRETRMKQPISLYLHLAWAYINSSRILLELPVH